MYYTFWSSLFVESKISPSNGKCFFKVLLTIAEDDETTDTDTTCVQIIDLLLCILLHMYHMYDYRDRYHCTYLHAQVMCADVQYNTRHDIIR